MMLSDGTHPFERSQAKVELDAGVACDTARYVLVTHKQHGCAMWRKG